MEPMKPDYFSMLPPEILTIIAGLVDHPKDMANLVIAYPLFREYLLHKRVEYLAPEVIKLIAANGYLITKTHDSRKWRRGEGILPTSYDVRRVCKSWCEGVDAYYEERFTNPQVQFKSRFENFFRQGFYKMRPLKIYSDRHSNLFLSHFMASHQNTERNPYFGRAVEFDCTERDAVVRSFRMYGSEIWGFRYILFGYAIPPSLYRYLLAMPNLKRFDFVDNNGREKSVDFGPPPVLPNLITLKTTLLMALDTGILLSNPSISNLCLKIESDRLWKPLTLPNVEQLKLVIRQFLGLKEPFDTAKLRILTIHWFSKEDNEGFDAPSCFQRLFDAMNRSWGNALLLNELELDLPPYRTLRNIDFVLNGVDDLRLELKYVEKLTLIMQNPFSLDFLLPMKDTLKYLRVKLGCQCFWVPKDSKVGKNCKVFTFASFDKQFYENKLWNMFPNLQEVLCKGHLSHDSQQCTFICTGNEIFFYTREQWKLNRVCGSKSE